jgi:TRAP-type C4-dicarboxylate transport system substrate-binding protein
MKKEVILGLLIVTSIITLLFGGCPAQEQEVIKLKLAYGRPLSGPEAPFNHAQALENWADKVEEETNGRVQIETYPGGSLLGLPEIFMGVYDGVSELGWWSTHYDVSRFSLTDAFALPGIRWPEPEDKIRVMEAMWDKYPELQAEYEGTKRLFFSYMAPSTIMTRDTFVHTPEDLKGLKIAGSETIASILQSLGASPITMGAADRYLALERGVIDGTEIAFGGCCIFNMQEVMTYFLENCGLGEYPAAMVVNQEVWDNLPSDIQQVFIDLNEWGALECRRGYEVDEGASIERVRNTEGKTVYMPTPQELEEWMEFWTPIHDQWVQNQKDSVFAREYLDEMLGLVK